MSAAADAIEQVGIEMMGNIFGSWGYAIPTYYAKIQQFAKYNNLGFLVRYLCS